MKEPVLNTGERVVPESIRTREDYLVYLLHQFNYQFALKFVSPQSRVLEVGCGEGFGTKLLSQQADSVVGLDVDPSLVSRCTQGHGCAKCAFQKYDGKAIPFGDNSFDVVVSFQVIEHVQRDADFVAEAWRVLKPGGTYILSTPNRVLRMKPGKARPWNRFHVREYDEADLKTLLKSKFGTVNIQGIEAEDEIYRIERSRVKKAMLVDSLDPLQLRRLIPESLTPKVIGLIKRVLSLANKAPNNFQQQYDLNSFHLMQKPTAKSLHLLAVCGK